MGIDICYLNNYAMMTGSAIHNNVEFLDYVIKNGGDIHAQNDSPIKFATYIDCLDNFKFLIKNGVDICNTSEYICKVSLNRFHIDIIKYLVELGIDFKQYEDCKDFFKESVRHGNYDCIKICLDMQMDLSIISENDLQYLLQQDISPEILISLINYGVDFTCLNKIEPTTEAEIMHLKCYDIFIESGVKPKTWALINYKYFEQ
ncbi:repeat protein [Moumouvirus goulette]|uniref:Repeat protein n=1 Tax=Moumouvirus goulette TaxID=1247379 RepID=M1PB36_9VIRU|nr:repeat protein [Moumouvirus goulette]AGF85094.1 repeat protein [Moumouvirus goulette]